MNRDAASSREDADESDPADAAGVSAEPARRSQESRYAASDGYPAAAASASFADDSAPLRAPARHEPAVRTAARQAGAGALQLVHVTFLILYH